MTKIKLFISFSLVLIYFTSCNNSDGQISESKLKNHKVSKECKKLNDSAIVILNNHLYNNKIDTGYLKTLYLLNLAISCDSNYFLALSNKSTVLSLQGNYLESIKVLNKLLSITNNDPEILITKGILFEKLGLKDSSNSIYQKTSIEYENRMKIEPNNFTLIGNKLFFQTFMGKKQFAIAQLKKYIIKNPNEEILKIYDTLITNFNREEFINNMGKWK